ncbi:MAG: chondroitinase family polysaccharide lyase [Acutalibacteraceae bacterium]
MKMSIKRIIVIFMIFCFICETVNINSYAIENSNIQSFEEGVPDNWKSETGVLETSTKHFKHKTQSLLWKWNKEDKLNVIEEKNMAQSGKKGGIILWLYSEKAIEDKLTFNFGTKEQISNNNPLYTFDCNINFTGWRAIWVSFKSDATNPNFQGKRKGNIEQMEIVAPKSQKTGEIYIDLVEFRSSIFWCRSQDYQVPIQRSDDVKGDIWQRNYYYIKQEPYLDLPEKVTQEEIKAFETIENRLDKWIYGTDTYKNESEMQTRKKALNKYIKSGVNGYNSLNITKSEDGSIIGIPLFALQSPYTETGKMFGRDVAEKIFLPLALDYKINHNEASLEKIINLFDYYHDQGWAEGSGLGTLNHETLRSTGYFVAVYLMREELRITGRLSREIGAINWYTNFGKLYVNPEIDYEATTADELRTHSLNRLIYVLLMENTPKKVQAMNSYVQWFNNALRTNPNLADTIKPDYIGYHHQAPYMGAYAPHGYHLSSVIIYLLRDTAFKISSEAQYNLKQALITFDILTNQTEVPIALRGRIVNSKEIGTEILPSYAYMAISGDPKTGDTIDKEMAGIFIKNWNISHNELITQADIHISYVDTLGAIDVMLDTIKSNIEPAEEQQGFWSKPYGGLAVKRKDNWMAMVKGWSKYIWDYESDSNVNIYGRYLSYGTMQILSQGNPINDKQNGYDYANGWDWNRMPASTTKHLELAQLNINNSGGTDRNYSDQTFLGSVESQDNQGVWAMSLHDCTYDTSFYAKKSVFFFDDEIILLGSNIKNNDTTNNTETTLFQSCLNEDKNKPIYIKSNETITQYPYETTINDQATWIIDPYGNGYYIPNANNVKVVRNTQVSMDQSSKNQTSGEYATAWINHGTAPEDAEYEYAIKVQTTPEEMEEYSNNINYEVIQKDNNAHIVKNTKSNIMGYAIFEANTKLKNTEVILKTDTPILAMAKQSPNRLELSVSDPDLRVSNTNNMENSTMKKVKVELTGKWQIESKTTDVKITEVKENSTVLEFNCIDGKSIEVSLQKEEIIKPETVYYFITATANEGGSVFPDTAKVEKGQQQTFIITPKEGYEIEDLLINETSVGSVKEYTFENVNANQTIQAVFKKKETEKSVNGENNTSNTIENETESIANGNLPKLGESYYKIILLEIKVLIALILGISSFIKLSKVKD